MNSKSLLNKLLVATLIFATFGILADDKSQKTRRSTPEERKARREARLAAAGGQIDRPIKGRVVRIKLETDKISRAELSPVLRDMQMLLRVAVEVVEKGCDSPNEVGAFVLIAEQGEKSPSLLCAPEDCWSTINVTRLMMDKPDAETLKSRIIKETWRGLAYALGVGNSLKQPCVMRPIFKPSDLDAHKVSVVSPMPIMSMMQTVGLLKLAKGGQTTYLRACEEGWAPQPTNEIQKAIWEKVHELPTKPITIEPEKK